MRKSLLIFLIGCWILSPTQVFSAADKEVYAKSRQFAKGGQAEFAFMQFRDIYLKFPNSKYREQAIFGMGEYYFGAQHYIEAFKKFEELVTLYPNSKSKIFALSYLYKIAEIRKNSALMEKLKSEIVSLQQVSLIFRDEKWITYLSPLHQKHEAVFHIDTIEFYVEGVVFAKLAY